VLSDGTSYDDVTVVGRDGLNDLAFLKINGVNNLTPATIGDSSKTQVGQKVIAIGNALGQYQTTVTSGIISALNRPLTASDEQGSSTEQLDNLFQTDAAINPGNSGGPLVDLAGAVIGINTAVAQDAQGIGFAIPINDAKGLIKSVTTKGKIERAYLGVRYVSITPDVAAQLKLSVKNGAYITGENPVISSSPADKAGLRDKDIITKINGTSIDQQHPLSSVMAQFSSGDKIDVTYLRDGKENTVKVTLETYDNQNQ
jgi:serine protease Do